MDFGSWWGVMLCEATLSIPTLLAIHTSHKHVVLPLATSSGRELSLEQASMTRKCAVALQERSRMDADRRTDTHFDPAWPDFYKFQSKVKLDRITRVYWSRPITLTNCGYGVCRYMECLGVPKPVHLLWHTRTFAYLITGLHLQPGSYF